MQDEAEGRGRRADPAASHGGFAVLKARYPNDQTRHGADCTKVALRLSKVTAISLSKGFGAFCGCSLLRQTLHQNRMADT